MIVVTSRNTEGTETRRFTALSQAEHYAHGQVGPAPRFVLTGDGKWSAVGPTNTTLSVTGRTLADLFPRTVADLAGEALHAACRSVQDAIGQTDGGMASVFFTGDDESAFLGIMIDYVRHELGS